MLMTKRTQRTIQKCWQMQICVELFVEFSDTGCNISIGTQTDDAEMVPAPGAVVEEMNQVKIVYGENTYFQISHTYDDGYYA